jgi:hypothetical protein
MTFQGDSRLMLGSVHVSVSPEGLEPFPVEAEVFEEDTYLVLSSPTAVEVADAEGSLAESLADVESCRPLKPGGILVRPGTPVRILAVVHDLSREPSWTEEWVGSALDDALAEVELRELAALSLPVLGARHGTLSEEVFCRLLVDAMGRLQPRYIRYLWVRTAHPDHPDRAFLVAGELRSLAQKGMQAP